MEWAQSLARGESVWKAAGSDDWGTEVERLFAGLALLDRSLEQDLPPSGAVERLIQGPLADALTHVGQLAMLRGVAGSPVRPENYARAAVAAGNVGLEQAAPGREFDGDASRTKNEELRTKNEERNSEHRVSNSDHETAPRTQIPNTEPGTQNPARNSYPEPRAHPKTSVTPLRRS